MAAHCSRPHAGAVGNLERAVQELADAWKTCYRAL
jgi:hypothetical protein